MNFSERIKKCFTAGYSQSPSIQEITDRLLSISNVEVKLVNETDNTAEFDIIKIGGEKIASVIFNTNENGSMIITEYNDIGDPFPSISANESNYNNAFNKLKEIINNRLTKNFSYIKNLFGDIQEVIELYVKNKINIKDIDSYKLTQLILEKLQSVEKK